MSERTTYEYIEAVKEIGKLKEQLDTQRQRIAELEANLAESLRIIDDRKTLNDRHMGRIAELEVERDAANATIDSLMEQRKKGKSGTAHCLYCGYTGERKPRKRSADKANPRRADMSLTLSELWQQAEHYGELTPPLVDACAEEDADFGAMLMWAWERGRWPGLELGKRHTEWGFYFIGVKNVKYTEDCYSIQWLGRNTKHRLTAREVFDDLYIEWRKLTTDQKRKLFEGDVCG